MKKLRVLHLSGVTFKSLRDLPPLPHAEDVTFTDSHFPNFPAPSHGDLAWLKKAYPKIQSFIITDEERLNDDSNKLVFIPATREFHFIPKS